MFRLQTDQRDGVSIPTTQYGKPQRIRLENRVQTHAVRLTFSAPLVITDKTTGVTINKGSLLGAVDSVKIIHGAEEHVYNGRQLAYLTEMAAASQRSAVVRVPATASVVNGTYNLEEQVTIHFAHPFAVQKRETALMEKNPSAYLEVEITVNASATNMIFPASVNSALGTITVTAQQDFERGQQDLPWFQTKVEQRYIPITGTLSNFRVDLPVGDKDWLRGILLQEDTTARGEQSDILSAFRLRDGDFDLIGPNTLVDKRDYQRALELKFGGAVYDRAYTPIWFQHDGRLSNLYKPKALALYINAAVTAAASAGSSGINVALIKCTRDLTVYGDGRRICNPLHLPFASSDA